MDHLSNATYDDVVSFFRRYYAPNNASIAIAGDIDPAEARRLAEKWFADVPAGERIEQRSIPVPVIESTRRIMLEDRVQLPRLYMSWVSAPAYKDGDAAMTALGRLLAGGKNSRLYKRLVYELQIADDVSAFQNGGWLGGEFQVVATARTGHTLEELERVILEEIEKVKTAAPEPRELERIVNQYEVGFLEQLEVVAAKADQLNEYLYYTGTPDYFNQDLARFRALTPADLSAAARQFLDPDRRIVLSIVPRGGTALAIPGSRAIPNENLQLSPDGRRPKS
jgi:zinc protease